MYNIGFRGRHEWFMMKFGITEGEVCILGVKGLVLSFLKPMPFKEE